MTDKKIEPTQLKQGTYRSKLERTAFESWVADMILSGYAQNRLSDLYFQEFNRKIDVRTVGKTVVRLREEWKLAAREDTAMHINMELERLDIMEQVAWVNYRECGGTVQDTEVRDVFSYDEKGNNETKRRSLTTVKTKETPSLRMKWFDRIIKIQGDRRKVLKLEATVNINNIMAVKGYAFFDPGKDWDDPPNLPEANVIDAEFTAQGEDGQNA